MVFLDMCSWEEKLCLDKFTCNFSRQFVSLTSNGLKLYCMLSLFSILKVYVIACPSMLFENYNTACIPIPPSLIPFFIYCGQIFTTQTSKSEDNPMKKTALNTTRTNEQIKFNIRTFLSWSLAKILFPSLECSRQPWIRVGYLYHAKYEKDRPLLSLVFPRPCEGRVLFCHKVER